VVAGDPPGKRVFRGGSPLALLVVMRPVLIVCDGYHGQTQKIGETLAAMLRSSGHDAHVADPAHASTLNLARFDAILIGGAIHYGGVPRRLLEFVRAHRVELSSTPCAFFAVCMAAARHDDASKREVQTYLARFSEETGLTPARSIAFGGALRYTKYDRLLRFIIRFIAKSNGDPTDTTRDHEMTDWSQVLAFARQLADDLDQRGVLAAE